MVWEGKNAFEECATAEEKKKSETQLAPCAKGPVITCGGEEVGEIVAPYEATGKERRGGTFGMEDGLRRDEPDFVSGQPKSMTEFEVFSVTEVVVAEEVTSAVGNG